MNLNSIKLKQQMLDKIKIITSNAEKNLSVVDYQYNWFDSITENMRITHKNIEDYAYTRIAPFYEILNGDLDNVLPLIAANESLWLSAHSFDDFTDNSLSKALQKFTSAEIMMSCVAKGVLLPISIISNMKISNEEKTNVINTLTNGLMNLFSGQRDDLKLSHAESFDLKKIENVISRRQPINFFLLSASHLTSLNIDDKNHIYKFGEYIGLAQSLENDYYELFNLKRYDDIINGTKTLYIATILKHLNNENKHSLIESYNNAKQNKNILTKLLKELRSYDNVINFINSVNRYYDLAKSSIDKTSLANNKKDMICKYFIDNKKLKRIF